MDRQEFEEGEINQEEDNETQSSENDTDFDEWDDSQLVKEYDRAVAKAKRQVLKKLQEEMGLTNADIQEVFKDSTAVEKQNNEKKKKTKPKWTVGCHCRAVYSEDNLEYEAEIIQIFEPDSCIVKYFGYNNEEEVLLSKIKPSLGKYVIDQQIKEAIAGDYANLEMQWSVGSPCRVIYTENGIEYEAEIVEIIEPYRCIVNFIGFNEKQEVLIKDLKPSLGKHERASQIRDAYNDKSYSEGTASPDAVFKNYLHNYWDVPLPNQHYKGHAPSPTLPNYHKNDLDVPLPPPPPPPLPFTMGHNSIIDEAYNSLLMSWYMCGYYTGYYQRRMKDVTKPDVI